MGTSAAEHEAMRRALTLAATSGVPRGPNPRVGCVLLAPDGTEVGEGFHRGAGTPHAEVAALTAAGDDARGATAVVTLEPCDHTGRTGPCSEALLAAGVRRVVFAQADGSPVARGGAERLRAAGVEVEEGLLAEEARLLNRAWTFALEHSRPFVTWKLATTLDGRSAAADGSSRWVSSRAARLDTHRLRAECDVMMVGTGTVAVDDPRLTVRDEVDELLRSPAAPRRRGGARPRARPPRARRHRRDPPPADPRPARRARRASTPAAASTSSSRGGRPSRRRSCGPGWSTRSWRTSPRCCSGRDGRPSASSASAPSPTPSTCPWPTSTSSRATTARTPTSDSS